jgi:hypothetical protein
MNFWTFSLGSLKARDDLLRFRIVKIWSLAVSQTATTNSPSIPCLSLILELSLSDKSEEIVTLAIFAYLCLAFSNPDNEDLHGEKWERI